MKFIAIIGSLLFATVLSQTQEAVTVSTQAPVAVKLQGTTNEQKRKMAFKGTKESLQKVQNGGKKLAPQNWNHGNTNDKKKQTSNKNGTVTAGSQNVNNNRKTKQQRPQISKDQLKKQLLTKPQNSKKGQLKKGQSNKVERPQKASKGEDVKKGGFQWAKPGDKRQNKAVVAPTVKGQTVSSV